MDGDQRFDISHSPDDKMWSINDLSMGEIIILREEQVLALLRMYCEINDILIIETTEENNN